MMHFADLQFTNHILPLFDHTLHHESKMALQDLFQPHSLPLEVIIERQQIITAFSDQLEQWKTFTYNKINLTETKAFIENCHNHTIELGEDSLLGRMKAMTDSTGTLRIRSRLVQTILFLEKVAYVIQEINPDPFPAMMKEKLLFIERFLQLFQLDKYHTHIREDRFGVKDILQAGSIIMSGKIKEQTPAFWNHFFQVEAYMSIARAHSSLGFRFPTFDNNAFHIQQVYHPYLKKPVCNHITLTHNVMLLTGANMSGKSTLFKAISICVILAHLGLPVPATTCTIPYYQHIIIAINNNDNIESGYSHFMNDLKILKETIQYSRNNESCFLVCDELFRGTNADDGEAILSATIEGATQLKTSTFLFSTHFQSLQSITEKRSLPIAPFHIECLLENGMPRFTYLLKPGWSNLTIGRLLFEQENLYDLLQVPHLKGV
ncbi:DNA mismatch repair protein MutS [Filimonas lacunae]|uniref:DNA mismatch repair protein MutS n=1 Tax=Filimonas lacunae TaxID=477680 RepID=A0A1N7QM40_9BACT|nr:hypothetical protein [Filimonas lacunae]SIT23903.1 DNA mismatch repair protein MutS [Filimonas lacunae]